MELSWLTKLRIAAVIAVGVGLIGILAWPLAAPLDPFGPVSIAAGTITFGKAVALVPLAFFVGLVSYFLSWPYGREIGVIGVPAGLSVWAIRSGSIADVMQLSPTLSQRQALFLSLKWEPIFWLAIVAVGFLGVSLGWKIRPGCNLNENAKKHNFGIDKCLSVIIALIGSSLIAQFCIRVLAQDVRMFDGKLGSVVAQPAVGQIVFAVLVSFGLAAFVFKKFLNVSYVWTVIAGALVTVFIDTIYLRQDVLEHLVWHPAIELIQLLRVISRKAIIVQLPIGDYPQEVPQNPLETHETTWTYEKLNYLKPAGLQVFKDFLGRDFVVFAIPK